MKLQTLHTVVAPHDEIVVGVDGSDGARDALAWAADEAGARGADLVVVGVAPGEPARRPEWSGATDAGAAWQDVVDDAVALAATRCPDLAVRGEVRWGAPADALVAAGESADLLVVGARGTGGFAGLLVGSVADRCLHRAGGPVAVIRGARAGDDDRRSGRVVVGIDGSDESRVALCWAAEEARIRGTALEAVIAWQYPPTHAVLATSALRVAREADRVAERARADVDRWAPEVALMVTVVDEAVVPALLDRARGAGLLVVGPHGQGGYRDLLLGSVASQCTHHAPCPVVVVHCWELPTTATGDDDAGSTVDAGAVGP
jgi:nucleotide-binding universal stress UspA family protein